MDPALDSVLYNRKSNWLEQSRTDLKTVALRLCLPEKDNISGCDEYPSHKHNSSSINKKKKAPIIPDVLCELGKSNTITMRPGEGEVCISSTTNTFSLLYFIIIIFFCSSTLYFMFLL